MRNDEIQLRNDAAARVELGCPHFAGMFAMGASIDLITKVGIKEIEQRSLSLNQLLTERLIAAGWNVLSPLEDETMRSAETLVSVENSGALVNKLAEQKIIVTEKPQGIRIATDFFNNEDDIDHVVNELSHLRRA
jgi:selenocysteine lyase/cysteine desulfurase